MSDVGFDLRFGLVWSHLGDVGQGIEYDRRKNKERGRERRDQRGRGLGVGDASQKQAKMTRVTNISRLTHAHTLVPATQANGTAAVIVTVNRPPFWARRERRRRNLGQIERVRLPRLSALRRKRRKLSKKKEGQS